MSINRIAIIADLHIDHSEWNYDFMLAICRHLKDIKIDSILLLGDISNKIEDIDLVIGLFREIVETLIFIPGNHDIYKEQIKGFSVSSSEKLNYFLPRIAQKNNAIYLNNEILELGNINIYGLMGWFDYSYLNSEWLNKNLDELREISFIKNQNFHFEDIKEKDPIDYNLIINDKFLNEFRNLLKFNEYKAKDSSIFAVHFVPDINGLDIYSSCIGDVNIAFEGSYKYGKEIEKLSSKNKILIHGHAHNNQVNYKGQHYSLLSKVLGGEEDRVYSSINQEIKNALTILNVVR